MKNVNTLLALCLFVAGLQAQTTEAEGTLKTQSSSTDTSKHWSTQGDFSLNFSQLSLSNWAAGGLNSVSFNSFFNYHFNYAKGNTTWDNSVSLGFGMIRQGDNASWVKSDDKLDFASKYGVKANDKLYYAGLMSFNTQFVEGYETAARQNVISNFLAPAYGLLAVGFDYKPNKKLSTFFAPVTYKTTIVMDDSLSARGAFGVDPNSVIRSEMGGYLKVQYVAEIMRNVNYDGKLGLFSNYFNNPQFIDVSWENTFTMKVNEYISANFITHLIYDKDIEFEVDTNDDGIMDGVEDRIQFKQLFGAGLTYKF